MSRRKGPVTPPPFPGPVSGSRGSGVAGALLGNAIGPVGPAPGADLVQIAERYHRNGQFNEADRLLKEALQRQPNHPRAMTLMGMLLNRRQKHAEAERMLKKTLKVNARQSEAWNALGTAYRSQGRFGEAIKAYQEATALDPDFAGAYSNMGTAYRENGEFDMALKSCEKALALNPNLAEAWNGLARARRFQQAPEGMDVLKQAAESGSLTPLARKHAFFALGKIHDDLGRYDEAFRYYNQANALRTSPADAAADCRIMAEAARIFDHAPERLADDEARTEPALRPVFVLGMPRSGTTLIEQVLASHPEVVGGGELNFFTTAARRYGLSRDMKDPPKDLIKSLRRDAKKLRKEFFRHFETGNNRLRSSTKVVVDKTPFNFMYVGLISVVFPEARIVHCVRDLMDTGLSVYFTDFAANQPFSTDLATIGRYMGCYQRVMAHWQKIDILPILNLEYQNLIAEQEATTRELISFSGLDWDDKCLMYHKTERYISTPSDWQVRQPIYTDSVSRWRNYERHLGPLREALEAER
ncbi:MAG: sulfotransferase [Rhodospirillales bacterium]